jgi:hypothetical protein
MHLSKPYITIALVLVICLSCLFFVVGFIVDFSSGDFGPTHGGDSIMLREHSPFYTTNNTTVRISLGFTPAKGALLYSTYTIIDSNQKIVDSSLMLHPPFSSEYTIDKTLTNLANGTYTFTITTHYPNGSIRTPENETFIVDTSFKYPVLTVISPLNQTYNNPVEISYNINSKVTMSYYKLDGQDWIFFNGNTTLSDLSNGAHTLNISVMTEANRHIQQANEAQTSYFTVVK